MSTNCPGSGKIFIFTIPVSRVSFLVEKTMWNQYRDQMDSLAQVPCFRLLSSNQNVKSGYGVKVYQTTASSTEPSNLQVLTQNFLQSYLNSVISDFLILPETLGVREIEQKLNQFMTQKITKKFF